MSSSLPIVHIGYPRTGTTWLREIVLPRLRGVVPASDAIWTQLAWKLSTTDDESFYERTLAAFVEECLRKAPEGTSVVFGQSDMTGYYADPAGTMWRSSERVHRIFPDAKILIVVRRQDQILRAIYGLYIRMGGSKPLHDLLEGKEIEGLKWDFSYLEYDRLVERYHELYGPSRVLVLPFEFILADADRFLGDLLTFTGGEGYNEYETLVAKRVNRSFSPPAAFALRTWNGLFVQSRFNSKPRFGARSSGWRVHQLLNERVDPIFRGIDWSWPSAADRARLALIAQSYAESNARLERLIGYELGPLGYEVAAQSNDQV